MTYGTLDGTLPYDYDDTPDPQPKEYDGPLGGAPDPSQVPPIVAPNVGDAPPVPQAGGSGKDVSVDTPSLRLFADNMKTLSERARTSLTQLQPVDVRAGGFGEAYKISTDVNTQRNDFEAVLQKLVEGLVDLHDSMGKLASDYDTTEEMNKIKSQDLQNAIAESQSDFAAMLSAHGDPAT